MSENFAYAVLGWLAGIVGALVLEANRRHRTVRALTTALRFELRKRSINSAAWCGELAMRLQLPDEELVQWMLAVYERYRGVYSVETDVANLNELLLDQEKLKQQITTTNPVLRQYPTPGLDATVIIGDFPPRLQQQILELKMLFVVHDSTVNDSREFFRQVAEPKAESWSAATNNLNSSYAHLAKICRKIVDKSTTLLESAA